MIGEKPLVSFVVLSYNQQNFIYEAVMSALEQEYEPLEILLTDDCSTDHSFKIIEKCVDEYRGPHKVIVNRNQKNVGLAESLNRSWELTRGGLIIIQGGDDISSPVRTAKIVERWISTNPRPDLVFSDVFVINAHGEIIETRTRSCDVPTLQEVTKGKWFIAGGMAAAYSRHIAGRDRPLDPKIVYEDYVLTFRALVGNGIAHIPLPLVKYRKHDASIMANAKWGTNNRRLAQKRTYHQAAEVADRLQTWTDSGNSDILFKWRLKRLLAKVRLDNLSCHASRAMGIVYSLCALACLYPRMAATLFLRDVIRR